MEHRIRAFRRHLIAAMSAVVMTTVAPAAMPATSTLSAGGEDPAAVTTDFFARMSAQDLAGVLRYIPHEGFSEVIPESNKLLRLDAKAFSGLFQSGRRIDLRVVDVESQTVGDTAIVTGTRVGSIAPVGSAPVEGRLVFTMVWAKDGEGWKLRHIHFSTPAADK